MANTVSANCARYLAFLTDTNRIRKLASWPDIDANDEALLNAIAVSWASLSPLAVKQAMGLGHLGSPSTLYRRISKLRDLGLIQDESRPGNFRIKLLVPSKRALGYFNKFSTFIGNG